MSTILKGTLKKLGEKGPRKTWKKRFFIQRGNKLYYYVNEKSAQEKGFINLDEALAIERSEKPSNGFQIRTARRIYYLQAENQEQVEYWISGASKCLQKQSSDDNANSQLPVQIEQAESRIADLETQNAKLKNVIDFISNQLKCSANDVMQAFELGKALPLPHSNNNSSAVNIVEIKEHKEEVKEVKEIKEEVKEHNEEVKEEIKEGEAKEHTEEVVKEHKEEQHHEEHHEKEEEKKVEEVAAEPQEAKHHDDEENKPPVIIVTPSILEEKENKLNEADEKEKDGEESDSDDDSENEEDTQNSSHFGAQVLFEYTARKNYELSISANEVITVLSKHENGWWLGCNSKGVQGYFPGSYVRPIEN